MSSFLTSSIVFIGRVVLLTANNFLDKKEEKKEEEEFFLELSSYKFGSPKNFLDL